MRKVLRTFLACGAVLLGVSSAHAWRCGNLLVKEGSLLEAVLKDCGPPVSRVTVSGAMEGIKTERLVYGPDGGLYYILTFEDGTLAKIEQQRAQ